MIGFDYGTSNCAVAVMENGQPKILSLGEHGKYIPSTLYAPSRDIIAHWLCQQLNEEQQPLFKEQRVLPLRKGQNVLRELKLDGIPSDSPKSFLGASGLVESQVNLFEDIVAAMMSNIKTLAEENQQKEITQAVIGRPINFQGLKGEESNRQALTILSNAAKRVGYKSVEFQYEPVAAGFEYEASLQEETKVLVVDIGGGTTDCSMLLMGPKFKGSASRDQHLLAHTGVRIGGNDFDIQLALKGIMPSLGMNDMLKTGKPMPVNSFNQAVAINNINEQTNFYSQANYRYLQTLQRDAQQPDVFSRLLKVHQQKLSHRIVNGAEQAKIGLTEHDSQQIYLDDLAGNLKVEVNRVLMLTASSAQLKQIALLMNECVVQASCQPDVIFVTGGSAKSPVLNQFLRDQMPNTPLIVGDHFGSVTVGLARWAEKVFQ
jgi:hypothetical chaperone protein